MRRYEIRSEYGLADPELYKSSASVEDDPESVLEGVAMAGLVGLLRQLGDLAQFAAEIFHDLHEEAMATSARGHGLMARVQQLEAEFPKIEKAFLTKTDHSSFFSNSGIEWHPNLRAEQNLITRGDMPRSVMDSYEECRGPPRLFLLDKYDVAGAGACLKRYTDPSVFKVDAVSSGIASVGVQKEKKSRKLKKKGSRWRNGGTPDIRPSSHAKLHQLLLEERIQNNSSQPACSVKVKRRQYNDLPFNTETGKSYMEKIIQSSSPENGALCDASVYPLPLKFASENSSDSGHDVVDIGTVSPPKTLSPRKGSAYFSPAMYEVSKPSINITDNEIVDNASQSTADGGKIDRPYALCDMIREEDLAVDGESKIADSGYNNHSDDAPSETENYMDALATLESEIGTDSEHRLSRGMSSLKAKTHQRDSDANEEQSFIQGQYSDSQSLGNFSASDDGNRSVKREGSSVSYSDTPSTVAENMPLDFSAAVQLFPSTKFGTTETVYMPPDQCAASVEGSEDQSHDIAQNAVIIADGKMHESGGLFPDNTHVAKNETANAGESSYVVCSSGSNYIQTTDVELALGTDEYGAKIDTSTVTFSIPSQSKDDAYSSESTDACVADELCSGLLKSSTGVLPWRSRNLDTYPETKSINDVVVQRESASESSSETLVLEKTGLLQSPVLGPQEQLISSSSLETKAVSGFQVSPDAVLNLESLTPMMETPPTESSGRPYISSDLDKAEEVVIVGETSRLGDGEQTSGTPSNADAVQVDLSHNSLDDKDDVNSTNDMPQKAVEKDIDISTSANSQYVLISSDKIHSQDLDSKVEPPGFEGPHRRGLESDNILSVGHCEDSAGKIEENLEISTSDVETIHCERPTLDTCYSNPSQPGELETAGVCLLDDGTTVFPSSQASYLDHGSYLTYLLTDPAISTNQSPELPANDVKVKQFQADESASNCPRLHNNEMKSINCANVEAQNDASVKFSSDMINEKPSPSQSLSNSAVDLIDGTSPTSCHFTQTTTESHVSYSAEFQSQPSVCEITPQSVNQGLAIAKSMAPPSSVYLDHSFSHKGTQVNEDSSQSSSDVFKLQLAQSESLQSVGMEVKGNKQSADQVDSIQPNFVLLQGVAVDSHASSNTSPTDIITHGSSSELLLPISNLEGGGTQQAAHVLNFSVPCIVLQPAAPNIDFDDAPPLPPLPPMQWRMGKMQNHLQGTQEESLEQSSVSMTSSVLRHSIEGESKFGASCSVHPLPSALPVTAGEDVDCQHQSELFSNNLALRHGISYQNSDIISDIYSPTTEELHPPNPFLAEHPMSNEKGKVVIPKSTSVHQSGHESISSMENLAALSSEAETGQPIMQNLMEQQILPETSVEGEQLQQRMQISDREMTRPLEWSSEIAASIDGKPKKIPRPRSPLIDAVAAHDRSTLRKVTERVQPHVTPKVDERDSLLEQIRNRSFNLKPAVVNRPTISGPKTNLKVAAILEKATRIRKAFAGSDEDDDADSWSDS